MNLARSYFLGDTSSAKLIRELKERTSGSPRASWYRVIQKPLVLAAHR